MTTTAGWVDMLDPSQWPAQGGSDPFLVDSLISSAYTILAAEPAVGKTHLAVALVAALINQDETLLGQEVRRRGLQRVRVVSTDPKGDEAFRLRLLPLLQPTQATDLRVTTAECWDADRWQRAVEELICDGVELLIIDHVIGLVSDANDPVEAKWWTTLFTRLAMRGCAVLALTHTAKPGERGPSHGANAPYGNRLWGAAPRTVVAMTTNSDGVRTLKAFNNDGPAATLCATLEVEGAAPRWHPAEAPSPKRSAPRQRGERTRHDRSAWLDKVVEQAPPGLGSKKAVYQWLSTEVGKSEAHLKEVLGPLFEMRDGRPVRRGEGTR